jgi:hypothetical protein
VPTQDMERFAEPTDEDNGAQMFHQAQQEPDRRMMEHSKSHPRMLKSTFFLSTCCFPKQQEGKVVLCERVNRVFDF